MLWVVEELQKCHTRTSPFQIFFISWCFSIKTWSLVWDCKLVLEASFIVKKKSSKSRFSCLNVCLSLTNNQTFTKIHGYIYVHIYSHFFAHHHLWLQHFGMRANASDKSFFVFRQPICKICQCLNICREYTAQLRSTNTANAGCAVCLTCLSLFKAGSTMETNLLSF